MKIEAIRGDITTQEVDAIVNAANSSLLGGGGVDGAIHRAAGPRLLEACRELRRTSLPEGLPVGQAVATPGFDLPARWIIHTVGPNRHAGQTDPELLRSAFDSSLALAARLGCRSVAVPAVSAGVYGWDADEVARTAVASARALSASARALSDGLDDGAAGAAGSTGGMEGSTGGLAGSTGRDTAAGEAAGSDDGVEGSTGRDTAAGEAAGLDDGVEGSTGRDTAAGEAAGLDDGVAGAPMLDLVRFVLFGERVETAFLAALEG